MSDEVTITTGSAMDGLELDLVGWCGLDPLTDEQSDALWGTTTAVNLMLECDYVVCEETDGEEICNYTDIYYRFYVVSESDLSKAKAQLRQTILEIIS